jgi:hypothetical protein
MYIGLWSNNGRGEGITELWIMECLEKLLLYSTNSLFY